MLDYYQDTIVAIATASGRGGVGVVRVSGPDSLILAKSLLGFTPKNRFAHYCPFLDKDKQEIDQGIAIFFAGPKSFTGEDVLELQAHGGPVILDLLLHTITSLGGRLAEPGEFSKRAFLNDKLDLIQAEAVSDLINSNSEQAARSALRSLKGDFSSHVNALVSGLIELRVYVEAAIDFPEEEVDFLADSSVLSRLDALLNELEVLIKNADQGALLTEGIRVVIAGKPNAGKSSLLNALAGEDLAIVTNIEGTTRDVLREQISIDGMPLHIIDTAGLRESADEIERIGMERAWQEIEQADRILLIYDAVETATWPEFVKKLSRTDNLTLVRNKIDLLGEEPLIDQEGSYPRVSIAAEKNLGLSLLKEHLKSSVGYRNSNEGMFTARRRHLNVLQIASQAMHEGRRQLVEMKAGELLAEDLSIAQKALGEITGKITSDDLLGEIFSGFCIGK